MVEPAQCFDQAQRALANGNAAEALAQLDRLPHSVAGDPNVLHLRAIASRRAGRMDAARDAFARARKADPANPEIANNYANLLKQLGEADAALALYDAAIAARPGYRDAQFNKALLLQGVGRLDEALAVTERLCAANPADAPAQSARGTVLLALARQDEASVAFDAALMVQPGLATARHGRARAALELGDPAAPAHYRHALIARPGDRELLLGLAEALEAEGESSGIALLSEAVAANPDWVLGHEILARMHAEAGAGDRFADHYRQTLTLRPDDAVLHLSHWRTLMHADRHGEALAALLDARPALADTPDLRLMEAVLRGETGDTAGAIALIDAMGDAGDPAILFARGRIALRAGEIAGSAKAFERLVERHPGEIGAWAHLDLAWRLAGDARHAWLVDQRGLYGTRDLGLSGDELADLAEMLRGLHRTKSHPIGQSLRGGTQTRGRLFMRSEPQIVRLRDALAAAVADYVRALPPRDDSHPLLRHRDARFGMAGSWSVRLTDGGFHVSHIHPEGVLSSACYIALPDGLDAANREGWLELGRPPAELGLNLEPVAAIEPRPGRLTLFPSYLFHGTRAFAGGERLTVAFDLVPR